jgi:uncharacterized protein YjbI with pentapeptide repeats
VSFLADDLSGVNLSQARFDSVLLQDAILQNVDLSQASLSATTLSGADMTGVDLGTATLDVIAGRALVACPVSLPAGWGCVQNNLLGRSSSLSDCDLSGEDLTALDLERAAFGLCNLSGANLSGVNLRSASFYSTDFTNADLSNADLSYTYFTGACDFTGANFAGMIAPLATWGNSICPDGAVGDCCYHYVGGAPAVCHN